MCHFLGLVSTQVVSGKRHLSTTDTADAFFFLQELVDRPLVIENGLEGGENVGAQLDAVVMLGQQDKLLETPLGRDGLEVHVEGQGSQVGRLGNVQNQGMGHG